MGHWLFKNENPQRELPEELWKKALANVPEEHKGYVKEMLQRLMFMDDLADFIREQIEKEEKAISSYREWSQKLKEWLPGWSDYAYELLKIADKRREDLTILRKILSTLTLE